MILLLFLIPFQEILFFTFSRSSALIKSGFTPVIFSPDGRLYDAINLKEIMEVRLNLFVVSD
jgi:hypothetical protein